MLLELIFIDSVLKHAPMDARRMPAAVPAARPLEARRRECRPPAASACLERASNNSVEHRKDWDETKGGRRETRPARGMELAPLTAMRALAWIAVASLVTGCAVAPTTIESTWSDPTYTGSPFERVAVLALFDTQSESRSFERNAAMYLEERGVAAVQGHSVLPPDRMIEEAEMERLMLDADVDGILIFRLIAIDDRLVYEPPTPYLERIPRSVMWADPYYWYYYPRWNYYWHWRSSLDVTRSPGYWAEHTYVVVETSLYDGRTDRLVWSAKSETMNDTQFDILSNSIIERVSRELIAMDFVADRPEAVASVR